MGRCIGVWAEATWKSTVEPLNDNDEQQRPKVGRPARRRANWRLVSLLRRKLAHTNSRDQASSLACRSDQIQSRKSTATGTSAGATRETNSFFASEIRVALSLRKHSATTFVLYVTRCARNLTSPAAAAAEAQHAHKTQTQCPARRLPNAPNTRRSTSERDEGLLCVWVRARACEGQLL